MARHAISDIHSVDPTDPRFVQLVRNKMDLHHRNLRSVNLGHRISGQEAMEERWICLLD